MNILLPVLRTLAVFVAYLGFACIGVALYFLPQKRKHRCIAVATRHWGRVSCWIFNIHIAVAGDADIKPGSLIVANHVGSPDIFVLAACFPAFFVSKAEIADWPLFNHLARLGCAIFAERSRRHQVKEIIAEMQKRLEEGCSVILFPEGQATDGRDVLPFKPSTFAAAVLTRCAVVPVTLVYHDANRPSIACWYEMSFMQHILRLLKHPKLEVTAFVHQAIRGDDRRALADRSREIIRDKRRKETGQQK